MIDIQGKERVTGITIAQVDENRNPIPGTEEFYSCDTLLLSCGLIPENELSSKLGARLSPVTSGPVVNESLETSVEGVFACGNVLHVHDLVDYVSEEAGRAGIHAAEYIRDWDQEQEKKENVIRIQTEGGIRYSVPSDNPAGSHGRYGLPCGSVWEGCLKTYMSVYTGAGRGSSIRREKRWPRERWNSWC